MSLRPSWSKKRIPAIFSEILFQAKQNDIIKSSFKIGKNTATEHIGRHCSSVASYKKDPRCILTAAISVKKMSWGCAVAESIYLECMRPCIRTRHRGLNTSDY